MEEFNDQPDWGLSFGGKDSAECEDFIVKIKRIAYKNRKHDDDKWIAEFSNPCFTGLALRWYEDLDEEIQGSWRLLRRELLAQYPGEDVTIPTPAPALSAAPPPSFASPSLSGVNVTQRQGRIKFRSEYSLCYLEKNIHGCIKVTTDSMNALIVSLHPGPSANQMGLVIMNGNNRLLDRLGIRWETGKPIVKVGSTSHARIVATGSSGTRCSWDGSTGPIGQDLWRLGPNGSLAATWSDADGTRRVLDTGLFSRGGIFVAADMNMHARDTGVQLIFEEI